MVDLSTKSAFDDSVANIHSLSFMQSVTPNGVRNFRHFRGYPGRDEAPSKNYIYGGLSNSPPSSNSFNNFNLCSLKDSYTPISPEMRP